MNDKPFNRRQTRKLTGLRALGAASVCAASEPGLTPAPSKTGRRINPPIQFTHSVTQTSQPTLPSTQTLHPTLTATPSEQANQVIHIAHMADFHVQPEGIASDGIARALRHAQAPEHPLHIIFNTGDVIKERETNHITTNQAVFFIGTSGWTYDHWKGSFYPEGLPKSRWFDYYASRFSAVEVNATFYRAFKDQTYVNWRERAPQGFGYVLKAPKNISHRKHLVDVEADIQGFCRSTALLEDRLEMILLQVAPGTPYDLERLKKALVAFSDPVRVAVEFRNPHWFTEEVEALLKAVGATYCNPDSPRQKLTGILTSNRAYLRLHGRKHWYSYNYSHEEIKEIAELAREMAHRGARRVYIFFNNDFEGHAPTNALALLDLLRA